MSLKVRTTNINAEAEYRLDSFSNWNDKLEYLTTHQSKELIDSLPEYSTEDRSVHMVRAEDVANVLDEILASNVVGFDTESKPVFRRGEESKIQLIQIATTLSCYLFHKSSHRNFDCLQQILNSEALTKVGIGLSSDVCQLRENFGIELSQYIDLTMIFRLLGKKQQSGSRQIVAAVLDKRIKKSKKTSKSNWARLPYHRGQIRYAAEDATSALDTYVMLRKLFLQNRHLLNDSLVEILAKDPVFSCPNGDGA